MIGKLLRNSPKIPLTLSALPAYMNTLFKKFLVLLHSRVIYRVQTAHVLRSIALSFVSVYIPAFLLTHGYSLQETILFYTLLHGVGLITVFILVVPMLKRFGMVITIRAYYPLQIVFFLLLLLGNGSLFTVIAAAIIGGIANMIYWVPLNILFMRHTDHKSLASDFSLFFALPQIFGLVGPLIGIVLVLFLGFWANFTLTVFGLLLSAIPLRHLKDDERIDLRLSRVFAQLRRRKFLFFLEGFDNIIEESEWLWGIIVFLLIGSLTTPGLVSALESFGGALFTLFVGRYINKQKSTLPVLFVSIFALVLVWLARFFITTPLPAYLITIVSSFIMTLFLISYFAVIYRKVKNDEDAEFIILREIPTILGRMIVFGIAYLSVSHIERFYLLPIGAMIVLIMAIVLNRKQLTSPA